MKDIKKITERMVSYKGNLYMTWEYDYELAIMDNTGYDVSLKTKVHTNGSVLTEVVKLAIDPEQYIHDCFCNDNLINRLK